MKYSFLLQLGTYHLNVRINLDNDLRHRWNVNRHNNAEYELHIILKGKCLLELENKKHLLTHGDAIIISPGTYHAAQSTGNDFDFLSLSFSFVEKEFLDQFKSKVNSFCVCKVTDKIFSLCGSCYEEMCSDESFSLDYIKSLVSIIVIEILRTLHIYQEQNVLFDSSLSNTEIIDQFFEEYYADRNGEQKLADLLRVSKRQLDRELKKVYNSTFREKLIRMRLSKAKWLMTSTDLTLDEIASQVGYSSENAFSNMFKSQEKISPRNYRRMARENIEEIIYE